MGRNALKLGRQMPLVHWYPSVKLYDVMAQQIVIITFTTAQTSDLMAFVKFNFSLSSAPQFLYSSGTRKNLFFVFPSHLVSIAFNIHYSQSYFNVSIISRTLVFLSANICLPYFILTTWFISKKTFHTFLSLIIILLYVSYFR